jgi:hypothetical protein
MISSLGLFFVAYNFYTTEKTSSNNNAIQRIQLFRELSNDIINEHSKQIIETKSTKLMKFYSELIGLHRPNQKDALNIQELAYSVSIFNHLAQTIILIENVSYLEDLDSTGAIMNDQIKKIISQYIRHPRFRQYWFTYKRIYSVNAIINFMAKNYHL